MAIYKNYGEHEEEYVPEFDLSEQEFCDKNAKNVWNFVIKHIENIWNFVIKNNNQYYYHYTLFKRKNQMLNKNN